MNRTKLFDQARGFAIIAMVMANSSPLMDADLNPGFLFRLLFSFPAPTFVIVACAMVALTARKHSLGYYLQRGSFVFAMGAVVDVLANKIVPFQGFDVLYLMGITMPLAYLANKLRTPLLLGLIVSICLGGLVLQKVLGYQPQPFMVALNGEFDPELASVLVWKHWIIDGWFPLMPWAGIGFCGILFYRFYERTENSCKTYRFSQSKFLLPMIALALAGVILGFLNPSPFLVRHGYWELFYPPTLSFMLTAIGFVGLLLALSERVCAINSMNFFQLLGSMTLAMYSLHLLIISHVLVPAFFPVQTFFTYFSIYSVHMAVLLVCAFSLKQLREYYLGMPLMFKWLVGK